MNSNAHTNYFILCVTLKYGLVIINIPEILRFNRAFISV